MTRRLLALLGSGSPTCQRGPPALKPSVATTNLVARPDNDPDPKFAEYAHPERLVTTEWLAEHLGQPGLVVVESDEDVLLYETGHIPGAVKVDWHTDLNDPVVRDYVDGAGFAGSAPSRASPATPPSSSTATRTTGGRPTRSGCSRCSATRTCGCSTAAATSGSPRAARSPPRRPTPARVEYPVVERDDAAIRAFKDDVLAHLGKPLVDVRSPEEYTGERTHMPAYPQEGALRGGHIPGAASVPWARAAAEDGTFKTRAELDAIYRRSGPLAADEVDRLLPHRRALEPHLVRAHPPARLRARAQLRRLVDRVGQRRARADRAGRRAGVRMSGREGAPVAARAVGVGARRGSR